MKTPWWAAELTAAFWEQAGGPEPFPRSLRGPIAAAFPLAVLARSSLSTASVRDYLRPRRVACPVEGPDRPLRACLVVRGGAGFIFLNAADDAAEQRFSLAHELAHFLRHYWQPRRRAGAAVGRAVLEVFDGQRPPGHEERLDALLASVRLGFHTHLMARDAGRRMTGAVAAAEEEADRLAYELLAPAKVVAERSGAGAAAERRTRVAGELRAFFGLPAAQADDYAAVLIPEAAADPLLSWLGLNF